MEQIENNYFQKMGDYKNAFMRVLSGHPATELLNFIDQENIDLAVVGTHGLTGLAHFFTVPRAGKAHQDDQRHIPDWTGRPPGPTWPLSHSDHGR